MLGAVVGARFANATPRMLLDYIGAAFGSTAVGIAIATFFGVIVTHFLPFPVADVVIAYDGHQARAQSGDARKRP